MLQYVYSYQSKIIDQDKILKHLKLNVKKTVGYAVYNVKAGGSGCYPIMALKLCLTFL